MNNIARYIGAVIDTSPLPKPAADDVTIVKILSIVFALAGSIAVLMVVISGFRYITANGDPNAMAQARKSIIYSVVGLIVTLSAYSIVIFVIKGVAK